MCYRIYGKEVNRIVITRDGASRSHTDYCWLNFNLDQARIGKARLRTHDNTACIYSIMIYPVFRGNGYASAFIRMLKREFRTIVADRVRPDAVSFWRKKGFIPCDTNLFIWKSNSQPITHL